MSNRVVYETYRNVMIDLEEGTITEYDDNLASTMDLSGFLKNFDGVIIEELRFKTAQPGRSMRGEVLD